MRLSIASTAPNFTAQALGGRTVNLAALRGRPVLLKFYRFATCPVCNLHMHHFIQAYGTVEALGLTTVVLFHSPAAKLEAANTDLPPFALVPDEQKRIFRQYGVENGLAGMFSPTVMRDYFLALKAGYPPGMFSSEGGITGNPADFIIDADGRIAMHTTAGSTRTRSLRSRLPRSGRGERLRRWVRFRKRSARSRHQTIRFQSSDRFVGLSPASSGAGGCS